jgi:predicted dehydrogenase
MQNIRVAVIGVGAFGRNHARVYSELQKQGTGVELAAVVDANAERAAELAMEFRTQAFTSLDQLLAKSKIDAASVAVPTSHHADVASRLLESGVDVLVEKPIAATLAQAETLVALAEKNGRIGMVGHLERFNPAVKAAFTLRTRPMFFEVHRLSIFTPRALDVDVVLDLMIHDLDIVLAMVDSPVREVRAVGLPILSPKVDIANVRIEFENGCVANFTASRVSTERVRKMRFFQPRQYVSVDYAKQDAFALTVDPNAVSAGSEMLQSLMGDLQPGAPPIPGITMSRPPITHEEPLHAELQAFLSAVRTRSKPAVSFEDGRRALALALQVNEKIVQHQQRAGLAQAQRT